MLCRVCAPDDPLSTTSRCSLCFSSSIDFDSSGHCYACRVHHTPFNSIRFLWTYSDRVRNLIKVMKYKPSPILAAYAGTKLAQAAEQIYKHRDWDILAPVPSSRTSLLKRGFNQCHHLAKAVELSLGSAGSALHTDAAALRHQGGQTAQASLPATKRPANVRHSFSADSKRVQNKRILLIDDVITTGATAKACAQAFYQAGAEAVDLLALARSDTWLEFRGII